jgi:hypothetical protein
MQLARDLAAQAAVARRSPRQFSGLAWRYDNDHAQALRAVRLDDSDDHVFRACGAAREGEWVVSGGFAVCDFAAAPRCDPSCHCESSFVALESRARCSIAEVVEVSEAELEAQADALAWHLVRGWGAPVVGRARRVAEESAPHRRRLRDARPEIWITVKRDAERGRPRARRAVLRSTTAS